VCGASFINEKFEQKLLKKIAKEKYLERNWITLKSIAQSKTTAFENYQKRIIDTTRKDIKEYTVNIDDLRQSKKKGFFHNNMVLKRQVHHLSTY
jgi:hypothetical protein